MIKIASLPVAGALLAFGLSAAPGQVGLNRTFVSGKGTDTGACTLAAPCRTFAFAFTQTAAGGEIDVLDPASYGPMLITKSISIVNDGVGVAAIEASTADAILIDAGLRDSVHLRGLTITGLGTGASGIRFITGGYLAIENCVVRDFFNSGINIAPRSSSSFSVSNIIASNNGKIGIRVHPAGTAVVTGVLSKITANNNKFSGISVSGGETTGASLTVTIADSETCNNGTFGVMAFSAPGAAATAVTVRNSIASNNINIGLITGANTVLRVAHSVVTGNGVGVNRFVDGTIQSYGNNDIDGNTSDNTGVLTPLTMHLPRDSRTRGIP